MKFIGNVLWFFFGGFISALEWFFAGLLCCITIIGIPLGKQCFKFAKLSLAPFGKDIDFGGGAPSVIANIVWIVFAGIWMAISNAFFGVLWCITIIGIPFGKQFFKLAKLSLMPFGAEVYKIKDREE